MDVLLAGTCSGVFPMRIRLLSATGLAGLILSFCVAAPAQEAKTKLPDNVIPAAFRAFLVVDGRFPPTKTADGMEQVDARNRTGKLHCLVCENGLAPVIAVFVRLRGDAKATLATDKGVGDLVKRTNALIPKYRADKLASFVMFLRLEGGTKVVTLKSLKDKMEVETKVEQDLEYPDEDDEKREKYTEDIRDYAKALATPNVPFGLAAEKSKAVTEWGIKEGDEVTVVVYYRMRVVKRWAFKTPDALTENDVTEILKVAENAIVGTKK
jgi:hypothetical protein